MAVNLIDNQLVKLYSVEDFNARNKRLMWDYRTYCQVVRQTQTTMFQIQVTPETDVNILTNGDFDDVSAWNVGNGTWVQGNGTVNGFISAPGIAYYSQSVAVTTNSQYLVEFNVLSLTGQVTVTIAPTPNYGNTAQLTIDEAGEYKFYFNAMSSTSVTVLLAVYGDGADAVFDYVSVKKLSIPTVTIENCDGVTQRTVDIYSQAEDRINYAIDWFGLAEDCYRVCVTGVDDTSYNYLEYALSLGTEGDVPLLMEQGGLLGW